MKTCIYSVTSRKDFSSRDINRKFEKLAFGLIDCIVLIIEDLKFDDYDYFAGWLVGKCASFEIIYGVEFAVSKWKDCGFKVEVNKNE